jgi:FkbM family methyltransferase
MTRALGLAQGTVQGLATKRGVEIGRVYPGPQQPLDVLDLCVRDHLTRRGSENFQLVQVGANDGATYDPVREILDAYPVKGLLIEPHPVIFERLRANYAGRPRTEVAQLAIGDQDGSMSLWAIRQDVPELPAHATQCCGFRRDVVERMGQRFIEAAGIGDRYNAADLVEEVVVPTRTMASVLEDHGIEHVDCLVMDTVGFDWPIIRSFPFDRWKPDILQFEHSYIGHDDRRACIDLLEGQGYKVTRVFMDTVAYLHGRGHRLGD